MRRRGRAKTGYRQDIALIANQKQWLAWVTSVLLLAILPLILNATGNRTWVTFINFTFLTVIAVLGLNVITGMSGQISLGHSAFIMVGGYTMAVFTAQMGWNFWLALLLSVVITGITGLLVATPAIRLKGFYVAVVTLAFFTIAQFILKSLDITGGIFGLIGVSYPTIAGLQFRTDTSWYYLLFMFTILSAIVSANISRSRYGRAFLAVRDNDVTTSSLGINVPFTKLHAFFIGSLFAGLAGGFWASYVSVIRLDQFTIWDSIWYIGMIIIGGAGSTAGTIMGVIFLRLLSQILHVIGSSNLTTLSSSDSIYLTYGIFGLIIILFVSFQPHGLISLWFKLKANYKRWPFGI
ncbi:branched-chain amino acid ABC transporter permease [Chloroflexota bacterium]